MVTKGQPRSITGTQTPMTSTGFSAGHPPICATELPSWWYRPRQGALAASVDRYEGDFAVHAWSRRPTTPTSPQRPANRQESEVLNVLRLGGRAACRSAASEARFRYRSRSWGHRTIERERGGKVLGVGYGRELVRRYDQRLLVVCYAFLREHERSLPPDCFRWSDSYLAHQLARPAGQP